MCKENESGAKVTVIDQTLEIYLIKNMKWKLTREKNRIEMKVKLI